MSGDETPGGGVYKRMNAVAGALSRGRREASDAPSFAAVAEAHLDDVYAYLAYLTRDRSVAEELTAATFERALKVWRRFDPRRGTAKTWLCRIAHSTALDHFRAESRRRRREDAFGARELREAAEASPFEGLSPELEAALATLSEGEREVVALRVLLDLDGESAARVLGITPTACSTRLNRALQKLHQRMESDVSA